MILVNGYFLLAFIFLSKISAQEVFTESAIFERLSHFKDAGLVNHLNTVDEAMIADGIYRMFHGPSEESDGYALWKNRLATEMVNNATKNLPPTEGPSHFVLTAHEELPKFFPSMKATNDDGYSCRGGSHSIDDMSNAMYNWHRALCAQKGDPAWKGVYDPAYMPQQMALTTGFMCIVACDCNEKPELYLDFLSSSVENAHLVRDMLCEYIRWGEVDFSQVNSDVDVLASLSSPLADEVCACKK